MLNKDQKQRLSLLRSMIECTKKEALDALEQNFWDSAMALKWLRLQRENAETSLDEFHQKYDEARQKSAVLPQDRYDIPNSKKVEAPSNRQARRAAKKNKKKVK